MEKMSEQKLKYIESSVKFVTEKFQSKIDIQLFRTCFPFLNEAEAKVFHENLLKTVAKSTEAEMEATLLGDSEEATEYRERFNVFDTMLCTTDGSKAWRPTGNPREDSAPQRYKEADQTFTIMKTQQAELFNELANLKSQQDRNIAEIENNEKEIKELGKKYRKIISLLNSVDN
ncbi:uncharacterized protein LOC136029832 [Artemia franciscana]|uniref:uncharacterized protein LOC136029832 n=1 Tax=Artemia franciscana TaxID=6661 RepID=UPI0032DAD614